MEHLERSLNIFRTSMLTFTLSKNVKTQPNVDTQNIKNELRTIFGLATPKTKDLQYSSGQKLN